MSREDIETIRASYDALNRRDYDAWLSNMHPDIELHELASNPDATVFRGHDELRTWLESVYEVAFGEGSRFEPEHFREVGDFIVVSVRASMLVRESSVPVEGRLFHVIERSEGKARRIWGYATEAEALEAVGLRE
jgi:ketosteroid isomerase-like protein